MGVSFVRCLWVAAAMAAAWPAGAQTAAWQAVEAPTHKPDPGDMLVLESRIQLRTALIRSREEFDAYMRANPGRDNPFNLLSPDGRRRFLAKLDFQVLAQGGMTGPADIEAELTLSQAWRLLSLFGAQQGVMFMPDIRVETEDDRLVEQWRKLWARSMAD